MHFPVKGHVMIVRNITVKPFFGHFKTAARCPGNLMLNPSVLPFINLPLRAPFTKGGRGIFGSKGKGNRIGCQFLSIGIGELIYFCKIGRRFVIENI